MACRISMQFAFLWLSFLNLASSLRRVNNLIEPPWEDSKDLTKRIETDSESVSALDYLQTLKRMIKEDEEIVALNYNISNGQNLTISDTYLDSPFFIMSKKGHEVSIGKWVNRVGNNVMQLMHIIGFAEAKGIQTVKLPAGKFTGSPGAIDYLFNLPEELTIQPKLSLVTCSQKQGFFFHKFCYKNWEKSDYRRILHTYLKPRMTEEFNAACRLKAGQDLGLVIHLRGGDLVKAKSIHPQSRMPPCSFYDHLIEQHNFTKVTAVAQDGKKDLCASHLLEKYKNSTVHVKLQSSSVVEDSCAIMSGQYVTFGLSTFSEALTLLNDDVKEIYVPAIRYNGMYAGGDMNYGDAGDFSGALHCGVQECTLGKPRKYEMYDIEGFEELHDKKSDDKNKYRLNSSLAISLRKSCDTCT